MVMMGHFHHSKSGRNRSRSGPASGLERIRGRLTALILRLLGASWRLRVQGMEKFQEIYDSGTPFILCFWHGKYIPVLPLFRGYKASVLTSLSSRGNVIGEICRSFGYDYVQIPDRGGEASLWTMEDALSRSRAVAIAVDGPLGPYHVVKKGVTMLASALGYRLLPLSLEADNKKVQVNRWDRMEFPKPFSRIMLVIGDPMEVPPGLSSEDATAWAGRLADSLEALDRKAAQGLKEKGP